MVKVKEDITGWKMWEHKVPDSRLIVLRQTDDYIASDGRRQARYLCECNCNSNKPIIASPYDIKHGKVKSCGCLWKEEHYKKYKKYNVYNLSGEYGIGYCSNTNSEFYVDLEDYELIKDYCWAEVVDKNSGYQELRAWDVNKKKQVHMHQVLGLPHHDHIDRNPLNNQKSNLRPASLEENNRNRRIFKNNTSGIMGVDWHTSTGTWRARINVKSNRMELGFFTTKEDAIRARLNAEKEYFGEFAPQRHLFKEYGIKGDDDNHNEN